MDLVCQERGIIEKAGRLQEQTTASPTSSQEVSRAVHVCVWGGGGDFTTRGSKRAICTGTLVTHTIPFTHLFVFFEKNKNFNSYFTCEPRLTFALSCVSVAVHMS